MTFSCICLDLQQANAGGYETQGQITKEKAHGVSLGNGIVLKVIKVINMRKGWAWNLKKILCIQEKKFGKNTIQILEGSLREEIGIRDTQPRGKIY
jgi:hypothetical protein